MCRSKLHPSRLAAWACQTLCCQFHSLDLSACLPIGAPPYDRANWSHCRWTQTPSSCRPIGPVLKEGTDSLSGQSSWFQDGWSLLSSWLPNLMQYCGVVATLFPGRSKVESSDFSILQWLGKGFRKGLSEFGLEGVLQAEQFLFNLSHDKYQFNLCSTIPTMWSAPFAPT